MSKDRDSSEDFEKKFEPLLKIYPQSTDWVLKNAPDHVVMAWGLMHEFVYDQSKKILEMSKILKDQNDVINEQNKILEEALSQLDLIDKSDYFKKNLIKQLKIIVDKLNEENIEKDK